MITSLDRVAEVDMKCRLLVAFCVALHECEPALAQPVQLDEDEIEVSYIYAAIMGTGTFKIDGRRITTLQLPLRQTRREMSDEQVGMVWHLPGSGNDRDPGPRHVAACRWLATTGPAVPEAGPSVPNFLSNLKNPTLLLFGAVEEILET